LALTFAFFFFFYNLEGNCLQPDLIIAEQLSASTFNTVQGSPVVVDCSENHISTNVLHVYNAECYDMKADGTYSDHCDLEDLISSGNECDILSRIMSVVYVTPRSNLNRKSAFLFIFFLVWVSILSVLMYERFSFSLFICKRRANCNI
jgi:hypothetical protein